MPKSMPFHPTLAAGRWFTFSLAKQMANIGSEVYRASKWQKRDQQLYNKAIERALELLDLTIADKRWRKRLKELTRLREVLCDAFLGGKEYGSRLEDFDSYFLPFTIAAH